MSFLKVGIIIHSIFCCFKPLRACPNSHGLSGFKPRLVGFFVLFSKQAHVFSYSVYISKEERKRQSEPSHKYKIYSVSFFNIYIGRQTSLT